MGLGKVCVGVENLGFIIGFAESLVVAIFTAIMYFMVCVCGT